MNINSPDYAGRGEAALNSIFDNMLAELRAAEPARREARLRDAAPDLLAALRGLLAAVRSNHPDGTLKSADDIFAEAGHASIAAIAKATGEVA